MGLDEGQMTLELHFENGYLRRWTLIDKNNGHDALGVFDSRMPVFVELLLTPAGSAEPV